MMTENHPLRVAREMKNLTMRDIAEKMGLGRHGHRRVYGWEHGETIPTILYANALAAHLGYESGEHLRYACFQWKKAQERQDISEDTTICHCRNCVKDRKQLEARKQRQQMEKKKQEEKSKE